VQTILIDLLVESEIDSWKEHRALMRSPHRFKGYSAAARVSQLRPDDSRDPEQLFPRSEDEITPVGWIWWCRRGERDDAAQGAHMPMSQPDSLNWSPSQIEKASLLYN